MSTTPLKDGVYIITNVKQRNSVFLENPDDETPLRGHYRQNNHSERWQVIDRGNGQHSIQNVGFQRYANSGPLAKLDAFIEGRDREQLWYIQERSKGKFTIATTDSGNFWMLPDNQISTPVGLLDKPTDQRCWWTFTNLETEAPVHDGNTREAVLFELKLLPIVPFSPLRLDFVVIQQTSDDSVSNVSRTIGDICGPFVSLTSSHPDNLRANCIEFKPFESNIFFQRFTGFLAVETFCDVEVQDISWKKCRGSSLPEMAVRGLRADATKVAILDLDATLLQQNGQAIIKLIHGLVKQNITLILTPIQPTFYDSDVFQELRNISIEFQPLERMDEFSDYIVDYNEMVTLPRLLEYPELRGAIGQAMPHIIDLLKQKDHEARLAAVTTLVKLAEQPELHDLLFQALISHIDTIKDATISKEGSGSTSLSWAARSGYEAVVRLLLLYEGVYIDAKDNNGRTPLSFAAGGGHEAVVHVLLEKNAVKVDARDNSGRTALSWAAGEGGEGVVTLLLAQGGVDVNSKSNNGDTPLTRAAFKGHGAVVRLLLAHEGVDVNARQQSSKTALSLAAAEGHVEVVKLLLAQRGVDVNSKSDTGDTPLTWAAFKGHDAVVRLLLSHKDIDFNARQQSSKTPLSLAAAEGHGEVVKLLLVQRGVDVNSRSNNGDTPLTWAAFMGHGGVTRLLLAHKAIDVNARQNSRKTALSLAATEGHDEVVKLLLAYRGVDVNSKSNTGDTPLTWAAFKGHYAVVRLLLAHDEVDVNAKQNSGRTPLLLAAKKGHGGIVRLLLAHQGVDVNAKDNVGWTPLSWATQEGHDEVVQLLQARIQQIPDNTT